MFNVIRPQYMRSLLKAPISNFTRASTAAANPSLSTSLQFKSTPHTACIPRRTFFGWFSKRKILYPERETGVYNTTRVFFQSVKNGDGELHDYLLSAGKVPILLNFTYRGDPDCNKLTGPLYDLLNHKIKKKVYLVDVECDEPANRDLMVTYGVSQIPTVVAVKRQLIVDNYKLGDLRERESIDEDHLKSWIETIAID